MIFTVIIPLYNKETYIKKAMESVLAQTLSDFELFVVNDGSTDKSLEVADNFKDERIKIFTIPNQGPAAARNLGIKYARGKLIAFLDADDTWEENHLETLRKLHHTYVDAGMYCTGYYKRYPKGIKKAAVFSGIPEGFAGMLPDYFKAACIDSPASASSVCIPAAVFDRLGRFDTTLHTGEDTDMWIRIALASKIAMHNIPTVNYNIHIQNSLSKSAFETDKLHLLSKYTAAEKKNPSLKKYLDLNRYAFAVGYTLSGKKKLRKEALKNINYKSLNPKQRILLRLPGFILKRLKSVQRYMAGRNRFLSVFKP